MFDDLQKQPDDIFAETDKSAPQIAPPTAPPLTPTTPPSPSVTPEMTNTSQIRSFPETAALSTSSTPMMSEPTRSGSRVKTIILLVGILVVIGAAFFISLRILRSRTPVTPKAPALEENTATPIIPEPKVAAPVIETTPIVETQLDTDKDGLTDTIEIQLGTDVSKSDTDGDGLFDREEVDVYKTNPLNPDTDGDSYVDGAEVKGGYNPNGPGKLLELPVTK